MSVLILIGGATAVGKSTITKLLSDYYSEGCIYRRVQAFYDYAKANGILKEKALSLVNPRTADDFFCKVCTRNKLVLSDVHYAVRIKDDSIFKSAQHIENAYLPTISPYLIELLHEGNIKIIAILITSSIDNMIDRDLIREKETDRKVTLHSEKKRLQEKSAEEREWKTLLKNRNIYGIKIENNENIYETTNQLFKLIHNYIP